MTQTSALSSAQITGLNSTPPAISTAGEGAGGMMKRVEGVVTALSADSTSSVYKMVRVPTTAKIKGVRLYSTVASAGAADINVAYSNSAADGTSVANQGTIIQISSANNKLFGAATSLVGTGQAVDCTFLNTTNFPNGANLLPLWKALGLTQDPGGMLDIQLNVSTQVTTGGLVMLAVDYVE